MATADGSSTRIIAVREWLLTFLATGVGIYEVGYEHSAHPVVFAYSIALFSGSASLAAIRLYRALKHAMDDDDESR